MDYGVIVRVSSETACPAVVVTEMRPDVAPMLPIEATGISIVVPLPEVAERILFLQNLTSIVPVNPVPVIVNVPPAPIERVKVERPVIDGGRTVEVSIDVTPLRPIVEPLPTWPVGWLLTKARKRIVAVVVSAVKFRSAARVIVIEHVP